MGGKAAKERRRLARMALNGGEGAESNKESLGSNKRTVMESNGQHKSKPHYPKKDQSRFSQSSKQHDRRPQARGNQSRPSNGSKFPRPGDRQRPRAHQQTKVQQQKKPKVKKPKHLKRKIEKLTEEEDEATRQRLIAEMKNFEARKSTLSTNKPFRKRLKPSIPPKQASKTQVQEPTVVIEKQVPKEKATPPPLVDANDVKLTASPPSSPTANDSDNDNMNQTTTTTSHAANDDDDSGSDSDSDSDVSLDDATRRQRGRRRRGRKSTDEHANKTLPNSQPNNETPPTKKSKSATKIQMPMDPLMATTDKSDPSKKTPKKDDKRHCIGRKPVTDYVVGQRCPGKVVYTKQFGAFIDIGCHSDAFCHVSRVRDDYVESISDALSTGQEVNARVVEVDRRAKRVTVSLQSDARIEDELASIEARKLRKEKHTERKRSENDESGNDAKTTPSSTPAPVIKQATAPVSAPAPIDESTMTSAELKRARKLARRAARREQQHQTGLAA